MPGDSERVWRHRKQVFQIEHEGKIALKKVDALKLVGDVKAELRLDVDSGPKTPAAPAEKLGKMTLYTYTDQYYQPN